jgi:hypothetical protein
MTGIGKHVFVIRSKCGAFLVGYEDGWYLLGKMKDALQFNCRSEAEKVKPWMVGDWEVVEYEKPQTEVKL